MSRIDIVGMAKQTNFATEQTTMSYFVPVEKATLDGNPQPITQVETVLHNFPIASDMGAQVYKLGIQQRPVVNSLPRMLSGLWGAPTTTTVDTTAHKHSFDASTASPVYHTFSVARLDPATDIVDFPYSAAMTDIKLSCAMKDNMKMTSNWLAAANDSGQSAPSATLDTSDGFDWSQISMTFNINGGGDVAVKFNTFEFDYQNNLEDDHFIFGQRGLVALPKATSQTAQLTCTVTEEDSVALNQYYRYALATTGRANVVVNITGTGKTLVGASTQHTEFNLKIWQAEFLNMQADVDATQRLRDMPMTLRCYYDSTNSKFVTMDVYNAVASY